MTIFWIAVVITVMFFVAALEVYRRDRRLDNEYNQRIKAFLMMRAAAGSTVVWTITIIFYRFF
jgi:hypothetical protein